MSFATYMDWALHDPEHGAYGSGRLQVGTGGDFATSPSLGPEFAGLLAPQLAQWLGQLAAAGPGPLTLLEAGPGEGELAADLARALAAGWPELAGRCQLVLIEPNPGMAQRQRQRLASCPLSVRWCNFAELEAQPCRGVLLAHEVLDALAVERVIWDGARWRRQQVGLLGGLRPEPLIALQHGQPLQPQADAALLVELQLRGLLKVQAGLPCGWTTELQVGVAPWYAEAAASLVEGHLLVIDYALEAWRYNAPSRIGGTLMAYRGQRASPDPLLEPGSWDLTAHLCLETLETAARATGWQPLGQRRQGEALLALGLAQQLHGLQQCEPDQLAAALASREALLRLVDPAGLGDFRWIAYGRGEVLKQPTTLFLREPH